MTEETEGKSAPDEDVTVFYRPTENCVSEEIVTYFHAMIDLHARMGASEGPEFVEVYDARTKRSLALFARKCIVRVDFAPHEDQKPPVANVKGVPTRG